MSTEERVIYEYRALVPVPYVDADHSRHPVEDHWCDCSCGRILDWKCPEHGDQVPKERRRVTTVRTFGEWEPVPAASRASGEGVSQ